MVYPQKWNFHFHTTKKVFNDLMMTQQILYEHWWVCMDLGWRRNAAINNNPRVNDRALRKYTPINRKWFEQMQESSVTRVIAGYKQCGYTPPMSLPPPHTLT